MQSNDTPCVSEGCRFSTDGDGILSDVSECDVTSKFEEADESGFAHGLDPVVRDVSMENPMPDRPIPPDGGTVWIFRNILSSQLIPIFSDDCEGINISTYHHPQIGSLSLCDANPSPPVPVVLCEALTTFVVSLKRLLNKQSHSRLFRTPWRSHDVIVMGRNSATLDSSVSITSHILWCCDILKGCPKNSYIHWKRRIFMMSTVSSLAHWRRFWCRQ